MEDELLAFKASFSDTPDGELQFLQKVADTLKFYKLALVCDEQALITAAAEQGYTFFRGLEDE